MTCPPFEILSAYVDGRAEPEEGSILESHLPGCLSCQRTLRTLRASKTALAALAVPRMEEELRLRLLALGRQNQRFEEPAWRVWLRGARVPWFRPVLGVSFAAFTCLALVWWVRVSGLLAPPVELPLDLLLAAHNQYALTLPLASAEKLMSEMPVQLASSDLGAGGAAAEKELVPVEERNGY